MPQGTLQAEDNIFILLYNLSKEEGGEGGICSKLQTVAVLCTQYFPL